MKRRIAKKNPKHAMNKVERPVQDQNISDYDKKGWTALKELYASLSETFTICKSKDTSNTRKEGLVEGFLNSVGQMLTVSQKFTEKMAPSILSMYKKFRMQILDIIDNRSVMECVDLTINFTPMTSKTPFIMDIGKIYIRAKGLHDAQAKKLRNEESSEIWKDKNDSIRASQEYVLCYEIQYRMVDLLLCTLEDDHADRDRLTDILRILQKDARLDNESKNTDSIGGAGIFKMLGETIFGGEVINPSQISSDEIGGMLGKVMLPEVADTITNLFKDKDVTEGKDVPLDKFYSALEPILGGKNVEGNGVVPGLNVLEGKNMEAIQLLKKETGEFGEKMVGIIKSLRQENSDESGDENEECNSESVEEDSS